LRRIWTIPAPRTKRSVEHAVPLSERAAAIQTALGERRGSSGSKLVFRGGLDGRRGAINRATIWNQTRRVSDGRSSVHGWRATLRSWCADHGVEFELSEAILAHSSTAVVAAYQRSGLVEHRRPIMQQWSDFLNGEEPASADIIPLTRAKA
jgi:integrase